MTSGLWPPCSSGAVPNGTCVLPKDGDSSSLPCFGWDLRQNNRGNTALHEAAISGAKDVASQLSYSLP